jgi:hypothetical protein
MSSAGLIEVMPDDAAYRTEQRGSTRRREYRITDLGHRVAKAEVGRLGAVLDAAARVGLAPGTPAGRPDQRAHRGRPASR